MGKMLSAEVKQALQDIYYNERTGRGKEALIHQKYVLPTTYWQNASPVCANSSASANASFKSVNGILASSSGVSSPQRIATPVLYKGR